ncbi:hypothetical protein [Thiohalocapsa sp. ML1]|jgi:hypothetical protein|uniref:hypothetical protein n=1 Tax=Thiohalocapsa sp. ML1 TaxID=1431688 RepID=UPI000732411A|nr:hypothetical protein [Thiohalocapsa sp. ML1]
MTTTLYIRAREPENGRRLIDELLSEGFSADRLHVYGNNLPQGLRVEATRWRSTPTAVLPGAVIGAVALPILWLLLFQTPSQTMALLLAIVGGLAGGAWSLRRERHVQTPLSAQRQALTRGELLIAAKVDDERVGEVERQISERHPEMLMLGPDPAGSPPFP